MKVISTKDYMGNGYSALTRRMGQDGSKEYQSRRMVIFYRTEGARGGRGSRTAPKANAII